MYRTSLAALLVLATIPLLAECEPERTPDTLFLANFELLDHADFAAGEGTLESHGATLGPGKWGTGLRLDAGQYVTISWEGNLDPTRGTILFWFQPNWSSATRDWSRALLSWRWDDGKDGYCVLSDGWWEPDGGDRTYFVFENQLYTHCSTPVAYERREWMQIACTWHVEQRPVVSLYINGYRVATSTGRDVQAMPKLKTPIHLGTDRGTSLAKDRWADGVMDGFHILNRALDEEEIRQAFRAQEPNWRQLERQREAWLYDVIEQPYTPKRDAQGHLLESRALLDEWSRWATREGAETAVKKVADAGFNVYIPCVWHGRGARWPSKLTPMETAVENLVASEGEGFDPLKNLIGLCHAKGIEVHPWFCVCYGDAKWKPLAPFIEEGTPPGACEAHNPAFRKWIVDLMMEVVGQYDVDGLNLDYIRTKGLSSSATAKAAYRERFGGDLLEDARKTQPNGWPNANIVAFQNEAIAEIVRTVSARARAAKPGLIVSVDGHPYLPTDRPGTQGRDGFRWAQEGWIDVVYSMDYGRRLSWQKADAIREALDRPSAFVTIAGNYERTKEGKVVSRDAHLVADLMAFGQRKSKGNGVALYWLGSLDKAQSKALRKGPFSEPAIPSWICAAASK